VHFVILRHTEATVFVGSAAIGVVVGDQLEMDVIYLLHPRGQPAEHRLLPRAAGGGEGKSF